jgi:hypothetical protein
MPLCAADDAVLVPFWEAGAAAFEFPPPQAAINAVTATSTNRGPTHRHRAVVRLLPLPGD